MDRIRRRERGVALLIVLSTLALVGSVIADFQYNSRIDLELALNARDQLQAEYNAWSALRLRGAVLRTSRQMCALIPANMPIPCAQLIQAIPIECSFLSSIARPVDAPEPGEDEEAPALLPGDCTATSQSEHSKIYINILGKKLATTTADRDAVTIANRLTMLLSNRAFERFFERDELGGLHAESAEEMVGAIADWIDSDKNQTGSSASDEDRYYAYLKEPYHAKNAPFDSLEELRLVHGVTDEPYDVLKKVVTIYPVGLQIELATATPDQLFWGLISARRQTVGLLDLTAYAGAFEAFVKALTELNQLSAGLPMGLGMGMLRVDNLRQLVQVSGLDAIIDPAALPLVFSDKQSASWFTIESQGRVGNAARKIRAVFHADEGQSGQYYYVRIE